MAFRRLTAKPRFTASRPYGRRWSRVRACPACRASLAGHRADASYCSNLCRAEAWRLRRLLAGRPEGRYTCLADRLAAGHALGPELLAAFAYGWPTHLLLAEHALAQRSTRNDSHRLKVPIAVRTLSEYGELDGCASLSPVSAPLAGELDERGHGSSLPRRAHTSKKLAGCRRAPLVSPRQRQGLR